MSRLRVLPLLCASSLGLSACSSFTASGDPLTQTEASELAGVIAQEGFVGFGGAMAAPPAAPGESREAADRITITIDDASTCEGGGTVAFAGELSADVDQEAETGTFNFNYTLAPAGCVVTTENDLVFTLTGDPNLQAEGEFSWSPTAFDGSLAYNGKLIWEAEDGREGVCGIDLSTNFEVSVNQEVSSGSINVTGTVCGVTINRTVSFETD
jgi:hypothetical protein